MLGAAVLFGASRLWKSGSQYQRFAALGFILVLIACFLGAIRFLGLADVVYYHSLASAVSAQIGLPMIGIAFLRPAFLMPRKTAGYIFAIVLLIALFIIFRHFYSQPLYPVIIGALGLGMIALSALRKMFEAPRPAVFSLIGAGLIAYAGLAVNTNGTMYGMPGLDLFHYILTPGYILTALGLRSL